MGLFDFLKRETNHKAVFIGLDNSGKSTIISFLQEGRFIEHTPTMGKEKVDIKVSGTRISMFDMGGQKDFRQLWLGELKHAKCVVFVVDKAAPKRFKEARKELEKVLPFINKHGAQLLILANKHDLKEARPLGEVIHALDLLSVEKFQILEISAKTGFGIADAFAKFYSLLTGEKLEKNKLTKAISVYNKGGVPIISQYDDLDEIERKAIEGGFLVAITQFCNMKMKPDDEDMNFIVFESKKAGSFVLARSAHFIGSLLWREDLNVTLEQSKIALADLLNHLEDNCDCSNEDQVSFYIEHYVTNMM